MVHAVMVFYGLAVALGAASAREAHSEVSDVTTYRAVTPGKLVQLALILILERPFKIGDLVEIDGVTGRIISIGLRASVVRHLDGIDTLIPNRYLGVKP